MTDPLEQKARELCAEIHKFSNRSFVDFRFLSEPYILDAFKTVAAEGAQCICGSRMVKERDGWICYECDATQGEKVHKLEKSRDEALARVADAEKMAQVCNDAGDKCAERARELEKQLTQLRAANDALTKAADELHSELAKNVLQEDSYGVPESSFYICPYCHHESGAGVLNKGITHAEDCILSGNYEIAMARIGTLAETQDKLATAEAEIEHLTAILAEREKELAEVRFKHDQACQTITLMQKARERRTDYLELSQLSLYLSQGMGDGSVTAEQYGKRIREGIAHMIDVEKERALSAANARIAELEKERDEAEGQIKALNNSECAVVIELVKERDQLRAALGKISKLTTSQNASPQQCEAVLIAMDALRGLPKDASRADTERLEGLKYALDTVNQRRNSGPRNESYLAALSDMEIFISAAIERVKSGQPMEMYAVCQEADAARALTAREEGEG